MILTILSMFSGGLLRLLPEAISLFNKHTDNSHELAMATVQAQLEQSKALANAQALETVAATTAQAQETTAMDTEVTTVEHDQMAPIVVPQSGFKILDAVDDFMATVANMLNTLVRPVTAYYFLALYGMYKYALLTTAMSDKATVWVAIQTVYTPDDATMLAGILSFYFVGRVFTNNAK
jgi:hypothetical protein